MNGAPIVVVRELVKTFAARGASLRAVDGVSFDVGQGETLGLVGESGSGKSTTGRILVGLEAATSGSIKLFDQEVSPGNGKAALRAVRRRLQFVFQDPQNSLNPCWRWSVCRVRVATVSPTNFPAANDNASASRARWR